MTIGRRLTLVEFADQSNVHVVECGNLSGVTADWFQFDLNVQRVALM